MGQIPLRPLRVLVVEDYADAREPLCMLLSLWGFPCDSAKSGPEALRLATSFRPDVVLMDIGLSGRMDGWLTAREIGKLPGLDAAVLIATTGYGRDDDLERSRAEGFVAHLTKPFDVAELLNLLNAIAGRKQDVQPFAAPLNGDAKGEA